MPRRRRWFAAWLLAGGCLASGVSAIGILTVPVGLVLVVVLSLRRPGWEALGLPVGLGAVVAWIGSINGDLRPCPAHGVSLTLGPGTTRSASFSCGGIDGRTWIIAGLSIAVAALAAYLYATRPKRPPGRPGAAAA